VVKGCSCDVLLAGKLGHSSEENVTAPCIVPALEHIKVVAISAGCEHSAVIADDGTLYTWGHGDGGRLGHGDNEAKSIPTAVEALRHMNAR
jgi:regulator of chromosome condensation